MKIDPSKTVRVQITSPDLPESCRTWYGSTPEVNGSPEATVEFLNKKAKRRNLNATYTLATEEAYWAYRGSVKRGLTTPPLCGTIVLLAGSASANGK